MNLNEYQGLANRTAKIFDTRRENLIHAVLGISSEAGELCETISSAWMHLPFLVDNIWEEIGDASWYAAYLCETMGWKFEELFIDPATASDLSPELSASVLGRNPPAMTLVLSSFAGEVASIIKAHAIYNKELDELKLQRATSLYVTTLSLIADAHGFHYIDFVLRNNISKLQVRYPDKYSDVAAIERADKKVELILQPGLNG